jgi:hypothetical protein
MSAVPARRRVRKATRWLPELLDRRFEVRGLDLGAPDWLRAWASIAGSAFRKTRWWPTSEFDPDYSESCLATGHQARATAASKHPAQAWTSTFQKFWDKAPIIVGRLGNDILPFAGFSERMMGLEPTTFCMASRRSTN